MKCKDITKCVVVSFSLICCAAFASEPTNYFGHVTNDLYIYSSTNIVVTNTTMWNFVLDAKNLTKEEKIAFSKMATAYRQMPLYGSMGVEIVASIVKSLDQQREIEKILKGLQKELQSKTNVVWEYESYIRNKREGDFLVPRWMIHGSGTNFYELGFREDGFTIWRKVNQYGVPNKQ